jgi:hypothetical protein
VAGRHLEHTLTRDNVIRDRHYAVVLDAVREAARVQLGEEGDEIRILSVARRLAGSCHHRSPRPSAPRRTDYISRNHSHGQRHL